MTPGIVTLTLAYVLSQFFRAFLAVLTPVLGRDLGVTPDDLARASGLWFLTFAIMQIPIGWALDTLGPRRTAGWLLLVGGGGGATLFALGTTALHIDIAMALIGVGCAPVLMASYYIFARDFRPARFAALASLIVGIGSLGNLVAAYPTAWAAEQLGWRGTLWGLSAITSLIALATLTLVRDPVKAHAEATGSLIELLRLRVLWLIYPLIFVSYAMPGAVRGLWIGPYLSEVFDASVAQIGTATLCMGLAMVAGVLAYGPADRRAASRKSLIIAGTGLTLGCAALLIALPGQGLWLSVALMCGVGFFGATYPVLIAHGRSFLPQHLIGRGVTLLNLCAIGGVGLLQMASGRLFAATAGAGAAPLEAYRAVFLLLAVCLAMGLLLYLFSRDSAKA
ncbi:MAG: MFS transporter [Pseudomonadota bacterium]